MPCRFIEVLISPATGRFLRNRHPSECAVEPALQRARA